MRFLLVLLLVSPVSAGTLLGTFDGPSTIENVEDQLGMDLELLASVDPPGVDEGLAVWVDSFRLGIFVPGGWSYEGFGDLLIVQGEEEFAAYCLLECVEFPSKRDHISPSSAGLWDSDDIEGEAISVSLWRTEATVDQSCEDVYNVPEPDAVLLALLAAWLVSIGVIMGRTRIRR